MTPSLHGKSGLVTGGAGAIVNAASNLALQGNVIQAAYSASKAAMIQMTRSIATSHGKRGIRCNAVLPGTPAAPQNLPGEFLATVEEETLPPYLGAPGDIAHIPGYARLVRFFGT